MAERCHRPRSLRPFAFGGVQNDEIREGHQSLTAKIVVSTDEVAKLRDIIREQHSELEDILGSLDQGIDNFTDGLREIENGVAELSKFL